MGMKLPKNWEKMGIEVMVESRGGERDVEEELEVSWGKSTI